MARGEAVAVAGQAVMDGAHPVDGGMGARWASEIETAARRGRSARRHQVRQVEPPVQRRQRRAGSAQQRELQDVDVEVHDVEVPCRWRTCSSIRTW